MTFPFPNTRLGILGGGQLGKMLCIAAAKWHLPIWILDSKSDMPAANYCEKFVKGNFSDYDDVLKFGREVDILTVEIEHVNTDALIKLQEEGVEVHPEPRMLKVIQDKGLQKKFYSAHGLPTAPFKIYAKKSEINRDVREGKIAYPFVQKSCKDGYDGRGVSIIRNPDDELLSGDTLVEPLIDIAKEISVIVARNSRGDIQAYPPVEMVFDAKANLLDMLVSPARLSGELSREAALLAEKVMKAYRICGLLAVELFVTRSGDILINEVAPRPHNSGHQTIEANVCSQYEQHLRAILGWPLGSTRITQKAVMINLLGAEGHTGTPVYEEALRCLNISGLHMHIYGKQQTRPSRKMGHVTITGDDMAELLERADLVKERIKVTALSR